MVLRNPGSTLGAGQQVYCILDQEIVGSRLAVDTTGVFDGDTSCESWNRNTGSWRKTDKPGRPNRSLGQIVTPICRKGLEILPAQEASEAADRLTAQPHAHLSAIKLLGRGKIFNQLYQGGWEDRRTRQPP